MSATVFDPAASSLRPIAVRLEAADLLMGFVKPLSRAVRCRHIAAGRYPAPFMLFGAQHVLVADIESFVERAYQRASEDAAINAERGRKMVMGRQRKRAERKAADAAVVALMGPLLGSGS